MKKIKFKYENIIELYASKKLKIEYFIINNNNKDSIIYIAKVLNDYFNSIKIEDKILLDYIDDFKNYILRHDNNFDFKVFENKNIKDQNDIIDDFIYSKKLKKNTSINKLRNAEFMLDFILDNLFAGETDVSNLKNEYKEILDYINNNIFKGYFDQGEIFEEEYLLIDYEEYNLFIELLSERYSEKYISDIVFKEIKDQILLHKSMLEDDLAILNKIEEIKHYSDIDILLEGSDDLEKLYNRISDDLII